MRTQCELTESAKAEIYLASGNALSAEAASHLKQCSDCAQVSAKQADLWKVLDAWTAPEVSVTFDRRLYAKVETIRTEPWYERWASGWRSLSVQPAWAFGAALILVAGGFVFDHSISFAGNLLPSQIGTVRTPASSVSTTEAEQVEQVLDDLEMLHQFGLASDEKEATSNSM